MGVGGLSQVGGYGYNYNVANRVVAPLTQHTYQAPVMTTQHNLVAQPQQFTVNAPVVHHN